MKRHRCRPFVGAAVVGLSWAAASPARADVVTLPITFVADVRLGSGLEDAVEGTGTITFDACDLPPDGEATFTPASGLEVVVEVLGQSFTETDDVDFFEGGDDQFPQLVVIAGIPTLLDFIVDELDDDNATPIDAPGVEAITISDIVVIPEPATGAVLALVGVACGLRRRRRSEHQARAAHAFRMAAARAPRRPVTR